MNTRDEIEDALEGRRGEELPPPAVFTQTGTVSQMEACGCRWPEANFDAEKMARLALQASKSFGLATVRVPFSIAVEAKTLGCTISEGRVDSQPSVTGTPYASPEGIPDVPDLMSAEEFLDSEWTGVVANAVDRLSKNGDLFLVAGMVGPQEVANLLLGTENAVMGLLMEPDHVKAWNRAMIPYQEAYAARLAESADCVMVIEEAETDLLPPDFFDGFIGESLPKVLSAANKGAYSAVHSCGDTFEVAEKLSSLGEDALSPEASTDMGRYVDIAGKNCRLLGSVNPVVTLLQGTPGEVRESAMESARAGFDIITPECGVPPRTPDANMTALAHYRGD